MTIEKSLADVALVLVHGIGTQRKGSSLTQWNNELYESFKRYGHPRLDDTNLNTAGDAAPQSVHEIAVAGRSDAKRVKVVEAWWADSFAVPSSSRVLKWSLCFALRVISLFLKHAWRLTACGLHGLPAAIGSLWAAAIGKRQLWRRVPHAGLVVTYLIGLIGLLLLGSIAMLALIPVLAIAIVMFYLIVLLLSGLSLIPVVKSRIEGPLRWIASNVGDASIWKDDPTGANAQSETVQEVIKLVCRGDSLTPGGALVIVAHSQGAAICVDAVIGDQKFGESLPANTTLISIGSGANLLGSISRSQTSWDPIALWNDSRYEWINFWALWDPVSAGPLGESRTDEKRRFEACHRAGHAELLQYRGVGAPARTANEVARGPAERPVYNTGLIVTDHTSYSKNRIQVVDPIVDIIAAELELCELDSRESAGGETLADCRDLMRVRRQERHIVGVRRRSAMRILSVLLAVALLPFALPVLSNFGVFGWVDNAYSDRRDSLPETIGAILENEWARSVSDSATDVVVYAVYIIVVCVVAMSVFNVLNSKVEQDIASAKTLRRRTGLYSQLVRVYMLLVAFAIGCLATHQYWYLESPGRIDVPDWPVSVGVVAVFVTLIAYVLQAQWGTRLAATPKVRVTS